MDTSLAPHVQSSPTSLEAAKVITPLRQSVAQKVYGWICDHPEGGATCPEIEVNLNLKHQTASPRLNELVRSGLVEVTSEARGGSSVHRAIQGATWSQYQDYMQGQQSKRASAKPDPWEQDVLKTAREYRANPTFDMSQLLIRVARNA
jgi:hypothetical protein